LIKYTHLLNFRTIPVLLAAACALVAEQRLSAPVEDMISTLSKYARAGLPSGQRVSFDFPEVLINSYLAFSLKANPRPGIESASVRFLPGNQIGVEAMLNMDVVAAHLPKPNRSGLAGVQPAKVDLKFRTVDGKVTLTCERFILSDKALPEQLATGIVRVLGSIQPEKYNITQPIPLPYGLKRLTTSAGIISADTTR
jgi:hypothetical protein